MHSLRSKLIAAFAFVILLSLTLAGSAAVLLLSHYQRQIRLNQLADLATPLAYQVSVLERAGATPGQIAYFLEDQADEMDVRILLLNPQGHIVEDTMGELQGRAIELPPPHILPRSVRTYWGQYRGLDSHELLIIMPDQLPPQSIIEHFLPRVPIHSVAIAVPQERIGSAWRHLGPLLVLAALISLLVSSAVAVLLARSISDPIIAITRASEQMAKGDYDQSIEVKGRDEVAHLATSFNYMAKQVALSHRTLRDFLANVSHELRTPLTSIQGFSQAIVDGAVQSPEEYSEAGRIIDEEARRMRYLVDELLQLSRIESGQIVMERKPLDLADLLRSVVRRQRKRAEEKGITLVTRLEPMPGIRGDGHWLERAFTNLLDNAFQHTPPGGQVTVDGGMLSVVRLGASQTIREVSVRVHNTGSHISEDDLARVFERFYQVDGRRRGSGSGLGLAVVREVVLAHGGTVGAESDPQHGTAFTVRLPATVIDL